MFGAKLDNPHTLARLVDVAVVGAGALLIVVAAGTTLTAPLLGVIALWALYYLVGVEWAGWETLGKRFAARAEPPAAAEPVPAAAPEPEPIGELGPELVSPALRELIDDLETAKQPVAADGAPGFEPVAELPELEAADHDDDEIDEATVEAMLEDESPADASHR